MKRALQLMGGALAALLLVAIVGAAYLFYIGPRLDTASKLYIDQSMPIILRTWSADDLWERAAPEFRTTVRREDLNNLFEKSSRALGGLQKYGRSRGEANIAFLPQKGIVITARYVLSAEFAKAPASVIVGLIRHGEQWQVLSFQINSPILLK